MHVPPGATRPGQSRYAGGDVPAAASESDQTDKADRLRRLRRVVHLLDEMVTIPGTRWRFGLDGLVGLIPGVGDVATTAISAFIVHQAIQMGVPRRVAARMVANIAVDLLVGAVPVVGDLVDFGWKSNSRNLRLLERHIQRAAAFRLPAARSRRDSKWGRAAWGQ